MTHRNRGIGLRIVWIALGISLFVLGQSWRENAWAQEELFVTNTANNSVRVYARTASGNTGPIRVLQGAATGLNGPQNVALDLTHGELAVANFSAPSVTVYSRTASGNIAPLRTLQGNNTGLSNPGFAAVISAGEPLADVFLNKDVFVVGATLTYQATLSPGVTPTQVDIYLGCLLPDFTTFLSLVQSSPGVITVVVGPSPVPFPSNVTLIDTIVQFNHTFRGFEPLGTYFPNAGIAVAGSNPFLPANQLSFAVQPFELG